MIYREVTNRATRPERKETCFTAVRMARSLRHLSLAILFALYPLAAQETAPPPAGPDEQRERAEPVAPIQETEQPNLAAPPRHWYNFSIPLVPTSSVPPATPGNPIEPLTKGAKAREALRRTVGIEAWVNRAALAGWSQWQNSPEEWGQGWEAYGKRYGYRYLRLASRNGIMLGADLLMGTDQRYDRCACTGFFPRTLHAFKRTFVARTDSGGETINLSRIAGAYGGQAIAYQALPERYRTAGRITSRATMYLGWRSVGNAIREFWPEIHRVVRIGPIPSRPR